MYNTSIRNYIAAILASMSIGCAVHVEKSQSIKPEIRLEVFPSLDARFMSDNLLYSGRWVNERNNKTLLAVFFYDSNGDRKPDFIIYYNVCNDKITGITPYAFHYPGKTLDVDLNDGKGHRTLTESEIDMDKFLYRAYLLQLKNCPEESNK